MDEIKLLLVDDETDFRSALARRLGKRNIVPGQAGNGQMCLSVLDASPADVVVLDVKMPGMDGIEVLTRIKEKYPEIEVILLTGQASTRDGVDGIKAGAFDYLTKPIEFEHLLSKIEQAYEKIKRTKEKREEADFRAKMEQQMIVTDRLASLGTLAVGVAHEINNPLAIIQESAGWMALLLKKQELVEFPLRKDFEHAIGKIEKGITRAKRITHQLLGFVRKQDSVLSEVNLQALSDEAVQLVQKEAANRDIDIRTMAKSSSTMIWSDPYQLRQVMLNLLTNAVHATGKGGTIRITIDSANDGISLAVADNGTGIPKENQAHIFEPFFSTKNPGEGTGLGLFVTRGILDRLGGRIDFESRLGQGTTFRVWLPLRHTPQMDLQQNGYETVLQQIKGERPS